MKERLGILVGVFAALFSCTEPFSLGSTRMAPGIRSAAGGGAPARELAIGAASSPAASGDVGLSDLDLGIRVSVEGSPVDAESSGGVEPATIAPVAGFEEAAADSNDVRPAASDGFFVDASIAAEFSHQAAILLSSGEFAGTAPTVFVDVVTALCSRVHLVFLVNGEADYELVNQLLSARDLDPDAFTFFDVAHDTMWVRDYGPFVRQTVDGSAAIFDSAYTDDERENDDEVPATLASLLGMHLVRVALELDGGNLIVNGQGLCVSTTKVFSENSAPGSEVKRLMRSYFGCTEIVFLEPLAGEDTGHVDMFAVLISERVVVVGEYDSDDDPINAAILDANAARLSRVKVDGKPLQVVRLPMPRPPESFWDEDTEEDEDVELEEVEDDELEEDEVWPTYTNVVFANGRLLVPVYGNDPPERRALVLSTYGRLLPGWEIVPIDATELISSGGALHCVTRHLPTLGALRVAPACPRK